VAEEPKILFSFLTGKDSFKVGENNRNQIDLDNKIKPFVIKT